MCSLSQPSLLIKSLLCRFVEKNYERLSDLFKHDPVLLQAFMILCPTDDLSVLISKTFPNFSLSWFTFLASEIKNLSPTDVSDVYSGDAVHENCFSPERVKCGVIG